MHSRLTACDEALCTLCYLKPNLFLKMCIGTCLLSQEVTSLQPERSTSGTLGRVVTRGRA